MSDFTRKVAVVDGPPPDPAERVNYAQGLVLGAGDYTQESAYLSGHMEWLARDTIGYGTLCGLQVQVPQDVDENGPRVVVTAGAALTPAGQLVRVPDAQRAYLNQWLGLHTQDVLQRIDSDWGSPPAETIALHLVLSYRSCPTADRPLPGGPCRSDEGPAVPSRLRDDFALEWRFAPPDQREHDRVTRFVEWLKQIEITDAGDDFITIDELVVAVREAALLIGDELASPPQTLSSPPQGIRIRTADACEYLRAAFRIWVTELRPQSRPAWSNAAPTCDRPTAGDSILIASVDVPIVWAAGRWRVDGTGRLVVHEGRRPYLLHIDMLQQWLLCGPHARTEAASTTPAAVVLGGDATGPAANTTVERIRNVAVASAAPTNGQVLTFDGPANAWAAADLPTPPVLTPSNTVTTETTFDQPATAGTATTYSRGDHTHGTPPTPALAGDVTGSIGNTAIAMIQSVPVTATGATDGQVLAFDAGANTWRPANPLDAPFVAHPASEGTYGIVAAARLQPAAGASPPPRPPAGYNGLILQSFTNGFLVVNFRGYRPPDESFQYIVKVMPFTRSIEQPCIVMVNQFGSPAQGIRLSVFAPNGAPLQVGTLVLYEFLVEISQYPFNP